MEQLLAEQRISFSQLASQQDVAVSTVWRWCTRGIRRIRLESMNVGGRRYTSMEAFERFVAATQSKISTTNAPVANVGPAKSVAHDSADEYLARQGV
ncbi:DUF1580 domain-containing protein [Lacipirellula limnantheis]|uniref:Uncharacterized protein n=1 Tax=Lacipirellula limnantheis TaxID=2528024 RepID=A0A517U1F4_9BACT|nr:DUF1580 domain-containing protein [Lacipirellula limnantheis]QDT74466.1 hypothetical protein I41_36630 [Lacipirellula limnantheis]